MSSPRSAAKRARPALALSRAALGACAAATMPSLAFAQFAPPQPLYTATSASAAQLDLGSNYLQRMGRAAAAEYTARDNSGGGGASAEFTTHKKQNKNKKNNTTKQTNTQTKNPNNKRSTGG